MMAEEKNDIWDELWTRKIPPEEREGWLYEVKAEGDKLKEKTENIKTHLDAVGRDRYLKWNIHPNAFDKLMKNLYGVLGVKT